MRPKCRAHGGLPGPAGADFDVFHAALECVRRATLGWRKRAGENGGASALRGRVRRRSSQEKPPRLEPAAVTTVQSGSGLTRPGFTGTPEAGPARVGDPLAPQAVGCASSVVREFQRPVSAAGSLGSHHCRGDNHSWRLGTDMWLLRTSDASGLYNLRYAPKPGPQLQLPFAVEIPGSVGMPPKREERRWGMGTLRGLRGHRKRLEAGATRGCNGCRCQVYTFATVTTTSHLSVGSCTALGGRRHRRPLLRLLITARTIRAVH